MKLKRVAELVLVAGAVGIGGWYGLPWDRIVFMAVLAWLIPIGLTLRR